MKLLELEDLFLKKKLQWKSNVLLKDSLIDYYFEYNGRRHLILVRNTISEGILNYLYTVGEKWDEKVIITEFDVYEELLSIAKKLNIRIIRKTEYCHEIDKICKPVSTLLEPIPQMVENISKLSPGTRLIIFISAGWKELLLIFILGFIAAIFGKEYIWPWIKYILSSIKIL